MIVINGKKYKGNNITVLNNRVLIDGKEAEQSEDERIINITIEGDIEKLDVDCCDSINIVGKCTYANTKNGNLTIHGTVEGNAESKNGNIVCGKVGGDVNTKNGNIVHQ